VSALDPSQRIALQQLQGVLVAALPSALTPALLLHLRHGLLEAASGAQLRAVLVDVSAVEVMDALDYLSLCETASMCRVMGRTAIVCGLTPGVVSSLVDLDVDAHAVHTARDVSSALRQLGARSL
jgi:anti-anti-sigma regulatory factor